MSTTRPTTRFIAIALCAAVSLFGGWAQAAEPRQKDFIWGVNGHPLVSYPGVPIATQLDAVRDLGMTSYRVDIRDKTDIAGLQDLVREASTRGITILPVVTPRFDLANESVESLEKMAYGLAFALVSGFKGKIPVWELGNEMENYAIIKPCEKQDDGKQYDCSYGPAGGVTALEYYGPRWAKVSAVLKGMTRGAYDADPSVRRAVGTAGWGHLGAFARMKADGIDWDISVWHMYGEDPAWAFKELVKYGKPIWVTEFNHPEGSTKSADAHAKGLSHAILLLGDMQETFGVEAAHVYELLDEPYWQGFEAHMGLIELTKDGDGRWTLGERKPAYAAVKDLLKPASSVPLADVQRNCALPREADAAQVPVQTVISYTYCLTLGRGPDGAGLADYTSSMAKGMTVAQFLVAHINSDEFSRRYGVSQLSNAEYARLIYRVLLGRDPDATEQADAVTLLDKKPRIEFQEAIIGSQAFQSLHRTLFKMASPLTTASIAKLDPRAVPQVHRKCDLTAVKNSGAIKRDQVLYSYCLVLGRWPESYGLGTYTRQMRNGMTLESVLLSLLQSGEFAGKYGINSLDDNGFVTLLYRLLLGREPDSRELASYVGMLQSGKSTRIDVAKALLASNEFRTKHEALLTVLMPEKPRVSAH